MWSVELCCGFCIAQRGVVKTRCEEHNLIDNATSTSLIMYSVTIWSAHCDVEFDIASRRNAASHAAGHAVGVVIVGRVE